jgi:hypothetical protein
MEYNVTLRSVRNPPFSAISPSGMSVHTYGDS